MRTGRNGRARRNAEESFHVANPGEAEDSNLFRMWAGAYGSTIVYVWAEHFEEAFEQLVEWLDDNAPGLLTKLEESDYKDAAKELGIEWNPEWPDWDDRDFQKVIDAAEADLTVIGHTTLKHGTHMASWEWGGDEIHKGSDEWNEAIVASYDDPEGPEYPDFFYEAFGPGNDEETATSGLRVELSRGGKLDVTEWTDRENAIGEDQPEGEKWSTQSIYRADLRELMSTPKFRGGYSGDKGWEYGELALMSDKEREKAIVAVAISALGYGSLNEERFVDGLWAEADY